MKVKILLLLSVLLAGSGQVLFKKGMSKFKDVAFPGDVTGIIKLVFNIVFSPIVFSGLMLYGLSTLLWLFSLSKTQLNYAYPFTALTFILVMLASYFIFSEVLPVNRIIGVVIIVVGVLVASIK